MKKILVIEDDAAYLKLLNDQLTKHGFSVIEANDGKKGLDAAISQHPDLILLDIRMPVMDGLEMLNELRKDPFGKTAKVILLTNLEPNDSILQKVIQDQPTYYFVKSDIRLSDLIAKINDSLPQHDA